MRRRESNLLVSILLVVMAAVAASPGLSAGVQVVAATDSHGIPLVLSVNPQTGSAHRVYGELADISRYGFQGRELDRDLVLRLSERVFSDYSKILGVSPEDLIPRAVDTDGRLWFVTYQQTYRGLPVEGTQAGYTLNDHGRIVALGADVYPKIDVETTPQLSAEESLEKAKEYFGKEKPEIRALPALTIFPKVSGGETAFVLTWRTELASEATFRDVVYFIDALTGGLVDSYDNIRDYEIHGTFSGQYYPQHYYDPLATASYSTTNIKIYNVMGQLVAQGSSNNDGYYSISFSAAYGVYFLRAPLENSWIQLRNASDEVFSHSYSFVPSSSLLHNYQWPAGDASNVRYHGGFVHDYYKGTFSYTGMDYRMIGKVGMGSGYNGAADGTNVFFGSQAGYSWARSSDVVYHEYTHNTIYHIYGGWIGSPSQYYTQASAMDEGLSDYFACTLNDDPIQGEDVGVNRNLDNNTYTWDSSAGAHWNGQVIGGACWDVRQAVGSAISNNLVFRALQVSPRARNFADYLENFIIADNSYYSGAHRAQILQSFANHGITIATLNASISGPAYRNSGQSGTWTTNVSGGVPPYHYQWWYEYPLYILDDNAAENDAVMKPPKGVWYRIGSDSPTLTRSDNESFELKCVVTDALGSSVTTNVFFVSVGAAAQGQESVSEPAVD